jgi:ParB family chromosome partitioning protein
MMAKLKGLGRGLDALLGGEDSAAPPQGELRMLAVSQLAPGKYQPRTQMDPASLQELADSIRAQGLMQPILVRELPGGGFEIIAGERRWRAAQLAGLSEVPVLVREVADHAVAAMALIENIQREDLNPLEEAAGIKRLIDEFGMTHQTAAEAVGRSRAAVSNLLRLLHLGKSAQTMLMDGQIDMGHARALLPLSAGQQTEAAHEIVRRGLSVREAEALAARLLKPKAKTTHRQDRDVLRLAEELADRLGAGVTLRANKNGAGTLGIHFASLDQLDGILKHIR